MTEPNPQHTASPTGTRVRRVLTGATVVVAVALTIVGVVGLLAAPPHRAAPIAAVSPSTPHPAHRTSATSAALTPACRPGSPQRLAALVFNWDTRATTQPALVRRIAAQADPTGAEVPGLLTDLTGYVPTVSTWHLLGAYGTRQQLTLRSLRTPAEWEALTRTAGRRLRAGTVAFTVTGVRTRTGTVNGTAETAVDEVAFTMFVLCPTTASPARLLRLSQLGTPLP